MGRGDNRRSPKTLRRKAWRRKKLRLKKKIDAARGATAGAPAKRSAPKK